MRKNILAISGFLIRLKKKTETQYIHDLLTLLNQLFYALDSWINEKFD